MRVVFATLNDGKLRELRRLVRGLPVEVSSLSELGLEGQASETGRSFGANACLKARFAAERCGGWALADDSGICVDALDGAPGIHSARWSGGGDSANNTLLLERLRGLTPASRGAAYVCALALAHPAGECLLVEADVRGRIAEAPRGREGFGYDPLFEIPEWGLTFGEAAPERKEEISHRARAFRKLVPLLTLVGGF